MFDLEDCGRELHLQGYRALGYSTKLEDYNTKAIMVIKAPRGTMVLFEGDYQKDKCKAIKAFMEQHKDD